MKMFHAQDAAQSTAVAGLRGHGLDESRGVEENSVPGAFQCFCGYVCNNYSTLRSHRFWKHKNQGGSSVPNEDSSIIDDPTELTVFLFCGFRSR